MINTIIVSVVTSIVTTSLVLCFLAYLAADLIERFEEVNILDSDD